MKPEHVLQIAAKKYLDAAMPAEAKWTAVDHGVMLYGDELARAKAWERLKARGVKKGVVDFHFWWSRKYVAIELKTIKGDLTPEERDWIEGLKANGFPAYVARSVKQIEECLRAEGFPLKITADGIDVRLDLYGPADAPKKHKSSLPLFKAAKYAKPARIRRVEAIRRKTPF